MPNCKEMHINAIIDRLYVKSMHILSGYTYETVGKMFFIHAIHTYNYNATVYVWMKSI